MTAPSPAEITKLRELLAKATPGPWTADGFGYIDGSNGDLVVDGVFDVDCDLIVAAVNAIPSLLDQLEAERARAEEAYDKGYAQGRRDFEEVP